MTDYILSRWTLPSLNYWIIVLPVGIIIGSLAGWITGYIKEKFNLPVGYTRKIFHFIIFTLAGITGLTGGFMAVQVFGTSIGIVVGYAVLRGYKNKLFNAIARPSDVPYERYYIIMPFLMTAVGGMSSNILFGKFAVIGYITTGWGDAVGEPVGTRWGKHKYRVPTLTGIKSYRSIEGSIAVLIASFIGCIIILYTGFHFPFSVIIITSFITAFTTMLVEAVTFHSLDNFTIQVISSGVGVMLIKYLM